MSVDVVNLLRELEITITEGSSRGSWLLRAPGGRPFEVAPAQPVQRLTSHVVRNQSVHGTSERVRPLLIGAIATEHVLRRAAAGEIDVLTAEPLRLFHEGVSYAAAEEPTPPHPRAVQRPAWTRWAVERYLLLAREPARQPVIAHTLGVSQQSVSNAARHLGDLARDSGQGLSAPDRAALLARWRDEYAGPGGQEFGWYSVDPVTKQAAAAAEVAALLDLKPLVSGDVAADRLAPWTIPTRARLYIDGPIDLAGDGFVPAPVEEATLVTCVPRDPTLWRLVELGVPATGTVVTPTADAAIVYWDLVNSAEIDSDEAAAHVAALIVNGAP